MPSRDIQIEPNPIRVKLVEDSVSEDGIRLTTLHLRYPRFIHSELMTHRVFSRNARSSRAVPVAKLLEEPIYMPHFMQNQPGMQSFSELSDSDRVTAEKTWIQMAQWARAGVKDLGVLNVHKQWANRPLEWFGFIDVLVSSTDWANWDALRNHQAAMPEIQQLAREISLALLNNVPRPISGWGDSEVDSWHLPYIDPIEKGMFPVDQLCKISTARCARISYRPFDAEEVDPVKDLALFDKLLGSSPVHASPAEHQATPDFRNEWSDGRGNTFTSWLQADQHGNFYGWRQFRKMLPNEAVQDFR